MTTWLVIIAAGAITYATRLSFILLFEKLSVPVWVQRALRYVPTSVMTAIFVPELLLSNGDLHFSALNPRLVAGTLAVLVAWRTRNVLLTILTGMLALWLIQSLV